MSDSKEYLPLWLNPKLRNEIREEDGRNDTERLENWKGEANQDDSRESLDKNYIEGIVEDKIQKLKQKGVIK